MTGILNILAGALGRVTDSFFEYVTLLLPGNGTNGAQNNTFLDGSTNNFTITRNGNTTQGTFSPFSQTGWGNYFDGTGDYLSIADNAALEFGSSDFTLEFWYYPIAEQNLDAIITKGWPTLTGSWLIAQSSVAGRIDLYASTNGSSWDIANAVALGTGITLNAWHHVVMTRSGNTLGLFVDGVRGNTVNVTAKSFQNNTSNLTIGAGVAGSNEFNGYISNLRMVVGSSVYDPTQTTLTVPTSALTAITNTSLLTCQSNRFIDNSTNNFTITVNGSPSVVAFSPFNPTASWSAVTNGGSGYFDGSGDTLVLPSSSNLAFGTGDFCVELWVYWTVSGVTDVFFANTTTSGAGDTQFALEVISTNKVRVTGWSGVFLTGATNLTSNSWNHIAACRSGTTLSLFLNGTRDATTTSANNWSSTNAFYIGDYPTGGGAYTGYMSNLRVVKGSSVYDPTQTTLTVPTAPLTAITNTSLLVNFTNAGIYDATSKNDLETVGNAQISNTTAKWGSTSMSFDGTGDYLLAPIDANQYFNFGTGDFTVECWFNANSLSATSYTGLLGCHADGGSASEWAAYVRSNGIFFFGSAGTLAGVAGTINTGTWYHYAASRSGNTLRLFLNGTQTTSATVTGSYITSAVGLRVGDDPNTANPAFNGYLQDVRITKGYARYTANFTAPTAAFPTL